MSRIGRLPIAIPAGVTVTVDDTNLVTVKGPKGTLTQQIRPEIDVEVKDGFVYINGEMIDDSKYINDEYRKGHGSNFGPYTIPEGRYFVMGDHRNNSNDSRAVGALPRNMIVGHARFVLWPIGNWRSVD